MGTDARDVGLPARGLGGLIEPGSLLEATPECLVVAAADGRILFVNRRLERLTGFSRAHLIGESVELLIAADVLELPPGPTHEAVCRRAEGPDIPVDVHLGTIDGSERLFVVTLRDISDLKAGREARFEAEAKYRSLVEHIPAVVYLDPVDEDSDSIYVSPQITGLIGIQPEEWIADPYSWRNHVHPEDVDRVWDEYQAACQGHTVLNHEYRMVHEDGSIKWVLEQAYPIDDEDGDPWLIQGVIFDISLRKAAEEQVAFLAYHDKLTGLPNRALFEEMLDAAVSRARRHDLGVGVLFLDLDNFKLVNDSLGHHAGDALLAQLAERLRGCTRETDLVARQGGDEFLLLLADLERGAAGVPDAGVVVAEWVADRVHEAFSEPFHLGDTSFYATGSIGISLYPQDATDAETLLRNADSAMYRSKKHEPGGHMIYASGAEDAMHRLSLTTRLRHAVDREDWVLHWQPIVQLSTGQVESVEALIRWREPNGGITPPGEFIPLAEELGLIEAIGDWVIDEVGRQHAAWRDEGLDLVIAFNLSPRQLWSAHLADKIQSKFRTAGVQPDRVIVEITESSAMADPDRTQKILTELRSWGMRLALDDFGTGYSSLARLKHMPVDILKIDRSFVHDVHLDERHGSMVRAMVQLAEGLGMTPLAEGVETPQELAFMIEAGCSVGQGFHFARPVPADQIPGLVARAEGLLPEPSAG